MKISKLFISIILGLCVWAIVYSFCWSKPKETKNSQPTMHEVKPLVIDTSTERTKHCDLTVIDENGEVVFSYLGPIEVVDPGNGKPLKLNIDIQQNQKEENENE